MEIGEKLFVRSRVEWRRWLARNHATKREIWLVYPKKSSGQGGIAYDESVEEALCYGWIDGQTKSIDKDSYAGRFTPRRPASPWSASNVDRATRLLDEGRMAEPGIAALPDALQRKAGARSKEKT